MRYKSGINRGQITLFTETIDDYNKKSKIGS